MRLRYGCIAGEVLAGVLNSVTEPQLPGIDSRQNSGGQRQLKHAAHKKALVCAMHELTASLRVQRKHAKSAAIAIFKSRKGILCGKERRGAESGGTGG